MSNGFEHHGPGGGPGGGWQDWQIRQAHRDAYEATMRVNVAQTQLTMAYAQVNSLRDAVVRAKAALTQPGDPSGAANIAAALAILGTVA